MIDGGKGQLSAALKARDEMGLTVPMIGLAKRHELIYIPNEPPVALEGQIHPHRPVAGDIKDPDYSYEKPAPREYTYREIELPLTSAGLMLLRKLRDEAHRFALTFHRKLRDKRTSGSALEEIPGVGPRRKRLLLRTFGSLEGVRRASAEDIAAVPTMTRALADKVRDYLAEG
jgi:excinuclease ABC subunit C